MRRHSPGLPLQPWLLVTGATGGGADRRVQHPPARRRHDALPPDRPNNAASEPTGGERLLRVKRIELARYLDVEGIVMQTSDVAVRAARNHLWAEDLAAQLHRDLRQRLAEQLDGVRVLGPDQRLRAPEREIMELTVTIDRFQGRFDGYAVVGGKWELLDSGGEIQAGKRFQRQQALAQDGYPALVETLKDAWISVVADIANGLRGAWADDDPAG
ncbi:MAG: ABC-type transport auxiliary lipoprotein family protein [Halofilum sp. (in: g-proteobacteria)]|nr:ABC-type transport auxiliary lipoprotein family protein [Halofilum sp. (in: g-proteobacteria)]